LSTCRGYFGGGGGGTTPGIVGGGGGGSSYVAATCTLDFVVMQGTGAAAGGQDRCIPLAPRSAGAGQHGRGGLGDGLTLSAGADGAVRFFKPGFYDLAPPMEEVDSGDELQ
jgi:hypothetical protein